MSQILKLNAKENDKYWKCELPNKRQDSKTRQMLEMASNTGRQVLGRKHGKIKE